MVEGLQKGVELPVEALSGALVDEVDRLLVARRAESSVAAVLLGNLV